MTICVNKSPPPTEYELILKMKVPLRSLSMPTRSDQVIANTQLLHPNTNDPSHPPQNPKALPKHARKPDNRALATKNLRSLHSSVCARKPAPCLVHAFLFLMTASAASASAAVVLVRLLLGLLLLLLLLVLSCWCDGTAGSKISSQNSVASRAPKPISVKSRIRMPQEPAASEHSGLLGCRRNQRHQNTPGCPDAAATSGTTTQIQKQR